MLKKIVVVLVALWLVGALFGEDDDAKDAAAGAGSGLIADAEADEAKPSARPSPKGVEASPTPAVAATRSSRVKSAPRNRKPVRTYLVARVVDGDTIELSNGDTIRVVGIDTPERGECGYEQATAQMEQLVLGKQVRLSTSDEDTDAYGRLLRYVNVGDRDAGLAQIKRGLAIARYDSRDGYGRHPREDGYIAADEAAPNIGCAPKPKPAPNPAPVAPVPAASSAYYENCTAARAAGAAPVYRGDPGYGSHLDRDGDGVACE